MSEKEREPGGEGSPVGGGALGSVLVLTLVMLLFSVSLQ